ncbi:hypothetical protein GH714_030928 [Hevea brasiliensis]|uniref:DBC1/CARP1 catalytically inactive NUDIX hydrolase domain-containing protein n=1 Tax=Hevea brasiliensis TaxID=3981 RepID=A0A6A6LF46_HEVBR|nr:hypothetical protein GH714_030928 [Hevea brasiliensis]
MYSSRGNGAYGQQPYGLQSGYAQNLGSAYSASSVGGPNGGSQHSLASRHSSMLSASQETDVGGLRSSASHFGGQYGAIHGSASMTGAQQVPTMSAKGTGPSALEVRGGYPSGLSDSPKFSSGDYVPSSSLGYGHKSDQLYTEKIHDYPVIDRRQYGERQSAYIGRDMQTDPAARYADSVGFSHQHQAGMYERIDQASMLQQEQLLKSQSWQSASLDGRPARGAASRHPTQDLVSYGGKMDIDPSSSSMLSGASYGGQHALSILGAAPRRNADDLLYRQSSSNPGYGVSLPPGRDYGTGKGLHGASVDADYHGGHLRIDERRDDKAGYLREFELREEDRRRELLQRDYMSIDKRYPRLFISPELSKVVINWPKENLKLSIHTPVSFEHDFIEDEGIVNSKEPPSTKLLAQQLEKSEHGRTIWNAKIILMSGLSKNALEELSSEKSYDDRLPHICNILRFAVLKRDRSFMAIGGPWDTADGGDPSVDDYVLVQTALRHARDATQIDLQNCHNWNRFLEIHYDRFGKDGFFSHREITVLFVPDLSDCLPSFDAWRDQWLAHKKAVAERERQLSLKKQRSMEKKEGQKDKGTDSSKESKRADKSEKTKGSASAGVNNMEKDRKRKANAQKGDDNDKNLEKKNGIETGEEVKNVETKEKGDTTGAQTTDSVKTGKKKIIRRIVKQRVANKKTDAENSISKQNESFDAKDAGESNERSEISVEQNESSADPSGVKTFVRKKVIKKVPAGKATQNEDKSMQPEVKAEKEVDNTEDKPKDNSQSGSDAVLQGQQTKKDDKIVAQAGNETENMKRKNRYRKPDDEMQNSEKKIIPKSKSPTVEKEASVPNSIKTEIKAVKEDKKNDKEIDGKSASGAKFEGKDDKQKTSQRDNHDGKYKGKDDEKSKDEKKKKDGKDESRSKSNKDAKEKRMPEEPPRHPGLILQTKGEKKLNCGHCHFHLTHFWTTLIMILRNQHLSSHYLLNYFMKCFSIRWAPVFCVSADQSEDQRTKKKEDTSVAKGNEAKLEDETDYEEDPEEDPEECEEMEDAGDDLSDEAMIPSLV